MSRLLEEEFARRAELERLQEQQAKLLAATQQERDALHGDRLEQERLLRETAQRLEQLEADRAAADEQMKVPYRTYWVKQHLLHESFSNIVQMFAYKKNLIYIL